MNFYLAVVDDRMRHAEDRPSIGLILCKAKNRVIAEYALRTLPRRWGFPSSSFPRWRRSKRSWLGLIFCPARPIAWPRHNIRSTNLYV